MFSVMAQAAPERTNAHAYGTINALSLAGHRQDGRRWVMFSFFGGGHGGNPKGDGLNHGNAPISTATIPPVEILEAAYPVMFTKWALRQDSGGAGKHRGGLGAQYELELLEKNADVFLFGERGKYCPQGVFGGGEALPTVFTYEQDDGEHHPAMVSKMVNMKLKQGQKILLETPGGGGYGRIEERKLDSIQRDLDLGYISPAAAEKTYRVVVDSNGRVDPDKTRTFRQETAQ